MVILRLGLFGISTLGFFELIRKASNDRVSIYFLPSLTIAIQVTILFLAGLLNLLPETAKGLYFIGFAAVIYSFYKAKGISFVKIYINTGYAVLLILLSILAIYLKGKIFSHYDNFSHWAIVVRRMLETNRYPNFEDTLIQFQAYPLGSATFIYFFAKFVSHSESVQMLAQSYMMLAAVLPLYYFAKKNQLAISVVFVSFVNFIFLYNTKITELLVDTLLPLAGVCGLLFTYVHCKECRKIMLFFSAFYMVQLIQIKNSGIFFVVFIAILIISFSWKRKEYLHGIICIVLPFISLLLWQKHFEYVFASAASSRHAMTVESFRSVFGEKHGGDITQICFAIFKYAISYKEAWIVAGICALVGALIFFGRKELRKTFFLAFAFSLVLYVSYQIGMLAMYLFSMPGEGAVNLAAIDRYTKTILVAILYVIMIPAVQLVSQTDAKKALTFFTTACIAASFFVGMYISSGTINTVIQNKTDATERNWIENAGKKYGVPMYNSYCILIPSADSGYASYLGKYIFQSNAVSTEVVESEENLNNISAKYIFVYDQTNEVINAWIQKNYPEQIGNEVIVQTAG